MRSLPSSQVCRWRSILRGLEEGRSDVTLEFTVRGDDQSYEVEIDDLHVL